MSVLSTFGICTTTASSIYYLGNEICSYLSGFHIIFQNITDGSTVKVLSLGGGLSAVPCYLFTESRDLLLVCEERRDGTSIALYEKTAPITYSFKYRLAVSDAPGTLFYADLISPTRLYVITGAPDYTLRVYDNNSKSATPNFMLTITYEGLLHDALQPGERSTSLTRFRALKLTQKDLLICAGTTLRCVKLGESSARVLPPTGLGILTGQRVFTDIVYLNPVLRKQFPEIPMDNDRLILLSTTDGSLVFMFNNTVIGEYKSNDVKNPSISTIMLWTPTSGPQQTEDLKHLGGNSVKLFDAISDTLKRKAEELSACFVATCCYGGIINVFGLLLSPICSFVTSIVYGNSARIEGKLNLNSVFTHLFTYSASALLDHYLARSNPVFHFHSVALTTNERAAICLGSSDLFKALFVLRVQTLVKRAEDLDRFRLLASHSHKGDAPQTTNQTSGYLQGEVTDPIDMTVFITSQDVFDQDSQADSKAFLLDPYSSENTELYLLKPTMSSGNVYSISTCPLSDTVAIVTTDRVVRVFSSPYLEEKSCTKFNEVVGTCIFHPSGNYLAIASTEYVLLCTIYNTRVERIHQFPIPFCKCMCFTADGGVLAAGSGSYLYLYNFYTRTEITKIGDFSGRIVAVFPVTRDFTPLCYSHDLIVVCSDGSACRFNLTELARTRMAMLRAMHFTSAAPLSAAFYLCSSIQAAGQGIISTTSRTAGNTVQSSSSLIPAQPLFFGVTSEGVISALNADIVENKKYSDYLNATSSVQCAGTTGVQFLKGRVMCALNVMNFLVLGHEFGFVSIRSITNLMNGEMPGEGSKEVVIPVSSGAITSLACNPSNNGFFAGTLDGVVYSILINKNLPPRTIVLSKSPTTMQKSVNLGLGLVGDTVASGDPLHLHTHITPTYIKRATLAGIFSRILRTRGVITTAKRKLEEKVAFLDTEFNKSINQLRQQTSDEISQYLSEYSRIEAEHDSKAILLKRQIANNENVFKDSLEALQGQYQRRLVLINDNLAVLAGQKLSFDKEVEEQIKEFREETERLIQEMCEKRDSELNRLRTVVEGIEKDIEAQRQADELLFNASENELYVESDQVTAVYERRIQRACQNLSDIEKYNSDVKARYSELESQLLDQKRVLLTKEKEIADVKAVISSQQKDLSNLRLEISSRDDTIANRERRVFELRKKIRELVKVKFVLDYKIREYSRQVEPRDVQLSSLKVRLNEMNAELQSYRTTLLQLKSTQKDLEQRNATLTKQIHEVQESSAVTERRIGELKPFINELGLIAYEDVEPKPQSLALLLGGEVSAGKVGAAGGIGAIVMGPPSGQNDGQGEGLLPRLGGVGGNGPTGGAAPGRPGVSSRQGGTRPKTGGQGQGQQRASGQKGTTKPPSQQNYYNRVIAAPGENVTHKRLVKALKQAHLALTAKKNEYTVEKERRKEEGNFSNLEKTICSLERKLSSNRATKKSSTSAVIQQNALLLQEINHLRRELHVAQVNSNAESKIDPRLLEEYEARKQEILRLRALIRKLEAGSVIGGAFLPEVTE